MDRKRYKHLIGGKPEQYPVLIKILRNALAEGRVETAQVLFDYLEQTNVTDTKFLFQAGLELLWYSEEYDLRVLRFIQSYSKKLPSEATTNYYVKHDQLVEAYENLSGYLSASPYSSSAELHGYAGWIAAELAKKDKRPAVQERFYRRALSHFDEYIRTLPDEKIDMVYLYSQIYVMSETGRIDDARILLESLIGRYEFNIALRVKLFELLTEDYYTDRSAIRECVFGIFRLLKRSGLSIASITPSIVHYLRRQLTDRQMKIEEFGQLLFLYTYSICLEITCAAENKIKSLLILLEACLVQFKFASLGRQWKILAAEFPSVREMQNFTDYDKESVP